MRRRVSLTVAMALWAFTAAAQPPQEAAQLAREGRTLAPAEVQVLENALKTLELTAPIVDVAWRNYFGASHSFDAAHRFVPQAEESQSFSSLADPLEL